MPATLRTDRFRPGRLDLAVILALAALLVVPLPAAADDAAPGTDRSSYRMHATYAVQVHLDRDTRRVSVDTTIAVRDTSAGPVGRLELNTIASRLGGIRLLRVSVNEAPVTPTVRDQTISLLLPEPLAEDGEAVVRVVHGARLLHTAAGRDHLWTKSGGIAHMYRTLAGRSRDGDTRIIVHTVREDARLWLRLARRELARLAKPLGEYP